MNYLTIKEKILEKIRSEYSDTVSLEKKFREHPCYSLLEIKNFLPEDITHALSNELESIPLDKCKNFVRKGSCMYEHNNLDETPIADCVVNVMHSKTFLDWLQKITDSVDLIPDPHLVGAGYMKSFNGDSLQVHTDFNWVEELKLHRRISAILYLNKEWNSDWGGNLDFYDTNRENIISSIKPDFGNLLIWSYHNLAFHGYPEPLTCPEGESRKGLRLFYYVSNATHDPNNPPHRSLYWFDKEEKLPYDIPWKK